MSTSIRAIEVRINKLQKRNSVCNANIIRKLQRQLAKAYRDAYIKLFNSLFTPQIKWDGIDIVNNYDLKK